MAWDFSPSSRTLGGAEKAGVETGVTSRWGVGGSSEVSCTHQRFYQAFWTPGINAWVRGAVPTSPLPIFSSAPHTSQTPTMHWHKDTAVNTHNLA